MTQHDPHRITVLVGVGEVLDGPANLARARWPAALMFAALVHAMLVRTHDVHEDVRAFLERRSPTFKGE